MNREYQCKCGQVAYSEAKDGPGPIQWSDGHTCRFTPVEGEEYEPSNSSQAR